MKDGGSQTESDGTDTWAAGWMERGGNRIHLGEQVRGEFTPLFYRKCEAFMFPYTLMQPHEVKSGL